MDREQREELINDIIAEFSNSGQDDYELFKYSEEEDTSSITTTIEDLLKKLNSHEETAALSKKELESLSMIDLSDWIDSEINETHIKDVIIPLLAFTNVETIIVGNATSIEISSDSCDDEGSFVFVRVVDLLLNSLSGIIIKFKDENDENDENIGGYFEFELEYGVDDSSGETTRENTYPLCKSFKELLDIELNPQQFIDNLDGEDVFGLFKKIEDDIFARFGDGDEQFVNIKAMFSGGCMWGEPF